MHHSVVDQKICRKDLGRIDEGCAIDDGQFEILSRFGRQGFILHVHGEQHLVFGDMVICNAGYILGRYIREEGANSSEPLICRNKNRGILRQINLVDVLALIYGSNEAEEVGHECRKSGSLGQRQNLIDHMDYSMIKGTAL